MSDEVLNCPFCGGDSTEFIEEDDKVVDLVSGAGLRLLVGNSRVYYGVRCDRCDIGITNLRITQQAAREAWNERTPRRDGEG